MGCGCCPRRKSNSPQEDDLISNRSVQHQNQNPMHHHSIDTSASCGYGFDLDNFLVAQQQQSKHRQEQSDLFQEFQDLYFRIKKMYKQHDIDSCIKLIRELKVKQSQLNYAYLDVSEEERKQTREFIQHIEHSYQEMLDFATYLEPDGWVSQGTDQGIKIYSRRDSGTVGILMKSQVQIPVQIFLNVMADTQLYDHLIPSVKASREEKHVERNHKIGYCLFDMPLLSEREAIFQGIGYNRLNHNKTIFIYSHSIHNRPDICAKLEYAPKTNPKFVQIDYKYLLIEYLPTGLNKGVVSVALDIDMKLNFLPMALLEMICKKFCKDFFWVVVEASNKFEGSKWQQKIKRHPQTFQFFRETIHNYYEANNIQS